MLRRERGEDRLRGEEDMLRRKRGEERQIAPIL